MRIIEFKKYSLIFTLILSSLFYINLINDTITNIKIANFIEVNDSIYPDLKTAGLSEPVHINNNWSAAKITGICTGDGISSNPYIIKDLVIDSIASRICITIENSIDYFIILNCTLFNTEYQRDPFVYDYAGVLLSNVSNGKLLNNSCYFNEYGIYLEDSSLNLFMGNNLTENDFGIYIYDSFSNVFSYNSLIDNFEGIFIEGSTNTISNNSLISNNEGISVRRTNNIISGNEVNDNKQGINVYEAWNNNIFNNNASYNTHSGIRLHLSSRNEISGNTINNNAIAGIFVSYDSNSNTISGNIANNNEYGIYLISSHHNTVSWNNMSGNTLCIYEKDCQGNEFSNNFGCNYPGNEINDGIPLDFLLNIVLLLGGISIVAIITVSEIRKIFKTK
ncbi:MAG: nitrous oxide reductase family maturation protein NosD [Candidatus Hermodarchaeota archaeon]